MDRPARNDGRRSSDGRPRGGVEGLAERGGAALPSVFTDRAVPCPAPPAVFAKDVEGPPSVAPDGPAAAAAGAGADGRRHVGGDRRRVLRPVPERISEYGGATVRAEGGAAVLDVEPHSDAAAAGLQSGDRVVSFRGRPVTPARADSLNERLLFAGAEGDSVAVTGPWRRGCAGGRRCLGRAGGPGRPTLRAQPALGGLDIECRLVYRRPRLRSLRTRSVCAIAGAGIPRLPRHRAPLRRGRGGVRRNGRLGRGGVGPSPLARSWSRRRRGVLLCASGDHVGPHPVP